MIVRSLRSSYLGAAVLAAALFFVCSVVIPPPPVRAQTNAATTNGSITITTGNTFQQVLAATTGGTIRRSITIQNNNTSTDQCWIFIGAGTATKGAAIVLAAGQSYQRYYPLVPSDVIQATCATTNDTLYVDTQ